MMRPATIARHTGAPSPTSFEGLRAQGIELVQAASGRAWTDYNLHDPGLTLLELLCFALTDLAYRAEFPVADLLTGPDGRIAFEELALHLPPQALPCRSATADDLRAWLVDRIDGLAAVDVSPLRGQRRGLWRISVTPDEDDDRATVLRAAEAAYRAQRALCEDLAEVRSVAFRWCTLSADIELGGPRDPLDVLAEVYGVCARLLAAPLRLHRLDDLLREGLSTDQVFDGPPFERGRVDRAALGRQGQEILFESDLLAAARRVEGVEEVRRLSLRVDDESMRLGDGLVRWRDVQAAWALRLRLPEGVAPIDGISLRRRGMRVELCADAVRAKALVLLRAERARQAAAPPAWAPPAGVHRPVAAYGSVQDQFPTVYGINALGVPPSEGVQRQAQAQQLRAYLALFEQHLANGAAQLQHLPELFSTRAETLAAPASYGWQTLDDTMMPGIDALRHGAPPDWRAFDDAVERKHRALDHLLALHGQAWTQSSLRQFGGSLSTQELALSLLQAKAAFVRDVVVLNRDRAAAFDPGRPAWNDAHNVSGLQRIVGLLLGFVDAGTRSLTRPLARFGRAAAASDAGQGQAEPGGRSALSLPPSLARPGRAEINRELARMDVLRGAHLPEAVLHSGVHRDRYALAPAGAAGGQRLWLGPDEHGRHWALADYPDEAAAQLGALALREFLLAVNRACEGLHVVEHLLLRPFGADEGHRRLGLDDGFYAHRLSVVLPAWTERCHQPNFRAFAQETVDLNCPAHLQAECLWLDFAAMQRFEDRFQPWLEAMRAHVDAASPAARAALASARDEAACALAACLLEAHRPGRRDA